MQDRYVGDVGDFVKYGLLRAISGGKCLGVAWYQRTEIGTEYLQKPDEWQQLEPDLFSTLKKLMDSCGRTIKAIEELGILDGAVFASEPLQNRERDAWFKRVKEQLSACNLVFADPDNGLSLKKSSKHILVDEAKALAEGRIAVIYHHNSRSQKHIDEIRYWMDRMPGCTRAYYWKRVSPRTFFIITPDVDMEHRLETFEQAWNQYGELVRKA